MFIKAGKKLARGYTLVEIMVTMGVFSIAGAALGSMLFFGLQSVASMTNYTILDEANRLAMDSLTREIRQARQVVAYSTNSISIITGDNLSVTYMFNPQAKQLVRNASDGTRKVLLEDCNLIEFNRFQRNPTPMTFGDLHPATTSDTTKVIQLTWKTSRSTFNGLINSESVQTARIVIRKQRNH